MKKYIYILSAALLAMAGCCNQAEAQVEYPESSKAPIMAKQIRVFSHRGGRMEFDENTMQAFSASYEAGYRGFETDIRMTADGAMVVTHDNTLERTTDGEGRLEYKTAEEIRALNTKKGNKMLFLEELCDWLDEKGDIMYVEFELKTKPVEDYPEERLHEYCDKLYEQVQRIHRPDSALFLFTSSDPRGLMYLREKDPKVELLLIVSKPVNAETIGMCKEYGINRLGAKMEKTTRENVEKAHKEGIIVSLWPGQSVADFILGAYLGSDTMCCDVPLEVMDFQKKNMPWLNVVY
ncbi:MAG: glycerophosphodiester phosphodiesterase [Bacteroidales bacterium]|nr:glycerophosphodiester phosphodiesterase [Bacteroidales bacterium]